MTREERIALVRSYLGKTVNIKIDRPMGSAHPKHKNIIYPVNYGYIPNTRAADGEEIDVYLLGVTEPLAESVCRVIAAVYRENDIEDKLVAAPEGMIFYQNEIAEAIHFQEQYYKTTVESIYEKSCGTVLYTVINNELRYLLLQAEDSYCGFPKGHMELGESEEETALRETWEETSVKATLMSDFRREHSFPISRGKTKTVVYFLASYRDQIPKHNPPFEYRNILILPFNEAYSALTYDNTKTLLKEADDYLRGRRG